MSSEACSECYEHMLLFYDVDNWTYYYTIAAGNDLNIEKSCFQDIGKDRPKFTFLDEFNDQG